MWHFLHCSLHVYPVAKTLLYTSDVVLLEIIDRGQCCAAFAKPKATFKSRMLTS